MAYVESVILGFSLAAIPGPIFFEVARRTLLRGFWSGALLSVGEFLANLAILALTFFGLSPFLEEKSVKVILFIIGGAILVWIGILGWRISKEQLSIKQQKEHQGNPVFVGASLALASPLAISVWASVGGSYLAQYTSAFEAGMNMVLLAIGVMLFFFALATIIHKTRHKLREQHMMTIAKMFGVILIGYGGYFFIKGTLLLFSA